MATQHLIWCGGNPLFRRLKTVASPKHPSKVGYEALKKLVLAKLPGVVDSGVARQAFYNRVQLPGESASEFAFQLKELSNSCQFEEVYVDFALRDKFIHNLVDPQVKAAVIKAKKATFDEAVSEAMLQEGLYGRAPKEVNRFSSNIRGRGHGRSRGGRRRRFKRSKSAPSGSAPKRSCESCGWRCRGGDMCPAIRHKWQCFNCQGIGHAVAVCKKPKSYGAKAMEVDQDELPENDLRYRLGSCEYSFCQFSSFPCSKPITPTTSKPLSVELDVAGTKFKCEVDTGACTTVITSPLTRK